MPERARGAKWSRRREAIVEAAFELFSQQGYQQTSIQSVCDAVGLVKGGLYYYVDSKEELLFLVLLRNHRRLFDYVVEHVDYAQLDPLDGVRTFVYRHVTYVLRTAVVSALYSQELGVIRSVDDWWQQLSALRRMHETFLRGLIETAQATGVAADGDATLSARALLSMANATHQWYRSPPRYGSRQIAGHHADLAVHALRASN